MSEYPNSVLLINAETCDQIQTAILKNEINPYENIEAFILAANLAFHELPLEIRQALITFQRIGNQDGGLLIRGLPIDPTLPPTPLNLSDKFAKKTFYSEFCCSMFSTALGEIFGYAQEKEGLVFQDVFPTPENKYNLSSESSGIILDFHTEVAFHPFLPDYVFLYCLRADYLAEAKTILASINNMLPLLSEEEINLLREQIFETGIDYSFGNLNTEKGGGRILSILHGNEQDPLICFDPDLMACLESAGIQVIQKLNNLAHKVSTFVKLVPGDLFIIDNKHAVHGRSEFAARFDGQDRWLQRVFVRRDIAIASKDRVGTGRIIRTIF